MPLHLTVKTSWSRLILCPCPRPPLPTHIHSRALTALHWVPTHSTHPLFIVMLHSQQPLRVAACCATCPCIPTLILLSCAVCLPSLLVLQGLGMKVLAYDLHKNPKVGVSWGWGGGSAPVGCHAVSAACDGCATCALGASSCVHGLGVRVFMRAMLCRSKGGAAAALCALGIPHSVPCNVRKQAALACSVAILVPRAGASCA